jgi:branched-chain amino acid transport system substrate-binding protein
MSKTRSFALLLVASLLLLPAFSAVAAEQELTIATILPTTGMFSRGGIQGAEGDKDYVDIVNEEGGIGGKKIKLVIEDGQWKSDVAMALYQKIMSTENPLVFFAQNTEQAKAIGPDFKNRYKMLVGSTGYSSELANRDGNPYSWIAGPTYGDQFGILLKYIAKEKPGAKVAFFYSDSEFGRDPIKFGRLMCDRVRLKLVAEEVVPLGAKDLATQIADLKDKDPDYVIFQGFLYEPVPQVIKACKSLGMKTKFMGTFYLASKWILDQLGPLAEGYLCVNQLVYWWDDVPMIKKLKDYNARKHPDVKFRDIDYTSAVMNMMITIECMRRADKAGELNREGVAKALQTIKDFDSAGLSGPCSIHNNRFPTAKVWAANPEKAIYEPVSDWIRLDRY